MNNSLVLDTNIIKHYLEKEETYFESCKQIIASVRDKLIRIALDHNREIYEGYKKQILKNYHTIEGKILFMLFKSEFYSYNSNSIFKLVDSMDDMLMEELDHLMLLPHDRIFMKIAPHSDLLKIISTNFTSFLRPECKEWINTNLEVDILLPQELDLNDEPKTFKASC